MACACKVNQEIDRIHRYYSRNENNRTGSAGISMNGKDIMTTLLIYVFLIPLVPLMFLFIVAHTLFFNRKQISLGKLFNFIHNTRNVAKQQVI